MFSREHFNLAELILVLTGQSHFRHFSALSYLLKTKADFLKWRILSLFPSKGTPTLLSIRQDRDDSGDSPISD